VKRFGCLEKPQPFLVQNTALKNALVENSQILSDKKYLTLSGYKKKTFPDPDHDQGFAETA
jgi:hypothetical protein